ncbi:MAG: HYR domain-containing protein, partial [Flavobacteriales bacterium]|nr:HYR domain-containing protein [Flavobacteriales bacterium]
VTLSAPTATDACEGTIIGTTTTSFPITDQGTTVVTWTYDDGNGNTSTQTQNVLINDTSAPVPDMVSLPDLNAECAYSISVIPTATDNCVGAISASTTDPLTYISQGMHTITWIYDDGNGNTSSQTQDIYIEDTTAPTADVGSLSDISAECQVNSLVAPSATDNCDGPGIMGTTSTSLPISASTIVTWTYTDAVGNTSTQTQNVIIDDLTSPIPDNGSLSDVTAECEVTSITPPTATDNCDGPGVIGSLSVSLPISSSTTITWTFEDSNGNTSTQTQNIIINDMSPPVPDNPSLSEIDSECAIASLTPPTATDNCDGAGIVGSTSTALPITTSTTITWTYTDDAGNSSQQTQDVIINDVTPPSINCPGNITIPTDNGLCSAIVTYSEPLGIDNCDGASTSQTDLTGFTSGDSFPLGITTLEYTVTAANGASSVCTFNIEVIDNMPPTVGSSVPTNISAQCDTMLVAPEFTDCTEPITVTTDDETLITTQGVHTIEWIATDAQGLSTAFSQTITIDDTESPVFSNGIDDDTVSVNMNCQFVIPDYTGLVSVSDNCTSDDDLVLFQNPATGSVISQADSPLLVQISAADENNQSSSINFWLVLEDNSAPIIDNCPEDQTVSLNNDCEFIVPDYSIIIDSPDNCTADGDLIIVQIPAPGTPLSGHGTIQDVTYTVTDESGNSSQCVFTLTLNDVSGPVFQSCPGDQFISTDSSCEFVLPDYTLGLIATDNCSLDSDITITQDPSPGPAYSGVQNIILTATDEYGNTSQCSFTVMPTDNILPTITCPGDFTDSLNESCEFMVADYTGLAVVGDNCTSVIDLSISQFPLAGSTMNEDFVVTLTVMDAAGNSSSCQFNVELNDDTAPTAICQDVTVYLDENGSTSINEMMINDGSYDNCSTDLLTFEIDQFNFECDHIGMINSVELTVYDQFNNSSTCSSNVTVLDSISPQLICPDDIEVISELIVDSVYVLVPLPDVVENCPGFTLYNDYNNDVDGNASGLYEFGTTEVTWSILNNGQSSSCTAAVTVIPANEPSIDCIPEIIVSTDPDDCGAEVEIELPSTTGPILSLHEENFGIVSDTILYFPIGETDLLWIPDNEFFSEYTCTTTVIVIDDQAPIIVDCPADTSHCGLILDLPLPVVTDNCGFTISNSIGGDENQGLSFPHGVDYDLVWTVSDGVNTTTCTTVVHAEDNTTLANAGLDMSLNAIFSTPISAWLPTTGEGYWTVSQGSGIIADSLSNNTIVSGLSNGQNILTWTVESEICGTHSDDLLISVRDFLIPNAFSPNGDGYNDLFTIVGIETIEENDFTVFNNWGKVVYSAKNYNNDWDGSSHNGGQLPIDTYFYILDVKGDNRNTFKGYIELRR